MKHFRITFEKDVEPKAKIIIKADSREEALEIFYEKHVKSSETIFYLSIEELTDEEIPCAYVQVLDMAYDLLKNKKPEKPNEETYNLLKELEKKDRLIEALKEELNLIRTYKRQDPHLVTQTIKLIADSPDLLETYSCPSCGITLLKRRVDYFLEQIPVFTEAEGQSTNFCSNCGQALDWRYLK